MRWVPRALALGGLAAAAAAGFAAVLAALGAPSSSVSPANAADAKRAAVTVSFGRERVVATSPSGRLCFSARNVARACTRQLRPDEIAYGSSSRGVAGLAGDDVRAVIVRLTHGGTVWATLRNGAFYARLPSGYRVRAIVKVLVTGKRVAFPVS